MSCIAYALVHRSRDVSGNTSGNSSRGISAEHSAAAAADRVVVIGDPQTTFVGGPRPLGESDSDAGGHAPSLGAGSSISVLGSGDVIAMEFV